MTLSATRVLTVAVLVMVLPAACAAGPPAGPETRPLTAGEDLATYQTIKSRLDKGGAGIDYDTLMQIHRIMTQSPQPIAHVDLLLRQLIAKRGEDPRLDQMILIFAAKTIGRSRYVIPGAQELFQSILGQDGRVNEWVLSFLAEAVADYPFDLPRGDKLLDAMEAKQAQLRSIDQSQEEHFGFHFLPPPRSDFIRAYISGIGERRIRQRERGLYYAMIKNGLTEGQIESALRFLQTHAIPGSGEKCPYLMQCLMHYRGRLPFP